MAASIPGVGRILCRVYPLLLQNIRHNKRRQDMWEPLSNLLTPSSTIRLIKQWTIVFLQNVKLLQQFISPYTGVVYDPTRTGRLPFQVPHLDSSNSHDAVDSAPPPPTMTPWHRWYHTIQPDETEVAQVKKTNKAYLK